MGETWSHDVATAQEGPPQSWDNVNQTYSNLLSIDERISNIVREGLPAFLKTSMVR